MKKIDEMDRKIKLRSEEVGYKIALLALAIWSLYESWQSIFNDQPNLNIPIFIITLVVCTQSFSEMYMKRKMIADDEEYKEPNKLLWSIVAIIAVIAFIISIGLTLYMKVR